MKTRGVITFVFDDGYQKVLENAVPLLDKYGMPGVFAIPIDAPSLEKNEYRKLAPWQTWKDIEKRGHEIASHSLTHPDLTTLPETELHRELKQPVNLLGASTFVYPGGAHDTKTVQTTKQYYKAARTVHRGLESLPPQDPHRLRSYNFTRRNFSPWKANTLALKAWLTNSWLIETYHMVDDDTSGMVHSVRTQDFHNHLRFIHRLPIATKTIREVI